MNGGSLVNSIVTGNSGTGSSNINTTAGVTNSCAPELTAGAGNLYDDPIFMNPGAGYGLAATIGDYHLQLHSSCIDAGAAASSSLDLDGSARPRDGDTDGASACDIGCYELSPTSGVFRCAFRTPTPNGLAPFTPVFRAYVSGADTNVTTYLWDFENDGTNDLTGPDKQVVSNTYPSAGSYTVCLTVSNAAPDSATLTRTNYVVVVALAYVSPWGSHAPPFTNWSTAATTIQAAVDSVLPGGLVLVTNAIYGITSPVSIWSTLH